MFTQALFAEPVGEEIVDYHKVISTPMDFSTMRRRLQDGVYTSPKLFERDLMLLCDNALKYNAEDTIFFTTAKVETNSSPFIHGFVITSYFCWKVLGLAC